MFVFRSPYFIVFHNLFRYLLICCLLSSYRKICAQGMRTLCRSFQMGMGGKRSHLTIHLCGHYLCGFRGLSSISFCCSSFAFSLSFYSSFCVSSCLSFSFSYFFSSFCLCCSIAFSCAFALSISLSFSIYSSISFSS
jgi:hypothetical protein